MTEPDETSLEAELLFTEEEWNTAMPELTRSMTEHLKQFRTPVFIDNGDYGEPWGSGSFIELDGSKFILTNEHVANVRSADCQLGFRLDEQEELIRVVGNHVAVGSPWDLALLPVSDEAWAACAHSSVPIRVDQIALAHTPVRTDVFAFAGYAGERTTFMFGAMQLGATTSLAREIDLLPHTEIDTQFHFGLHYLPGRATTVVGHHSLPRPPGLSGSTVWNTRFVEAKMMGISWTPELAVVSGVVWGWPSGQGAIVATKAEHLRSFLLGAKKSLAELATR